jgi:uncharacterized membrane protein (UPF0127 family)
MAAKTPWRLRGLPYATLAGAPYPLATSLRSRLLGLALLDRECAGPGLLIPRCRSVHTFGMRFALDVAFLDATGAVLSRREGLPRNRIARRPGAAAVLELPAQSRGRHL